MRLLESSKHALDRYRAYQFESTVTVLNTLPSGPRINPFAWRDPSLTIAKTGLKLNPSLPGSLFLFMPSGGAR
jgi:hypothetical protein